MQIITPIMFRNSSFFILISLYAQVDESPDPAQNKSYEIGNISRLALRSRSVLYATAPMYESRSHRAEGFDRY